MRFLIIFSLCSFVEVALATTDQDSAASCKTRNISTKNMPKNNSQSQHNWCVFWSEADLYSYYEEKPLSSYDLALQYFTNDKVKDPTIMDSIDREGNITAAMIIAQQGKGVCLESQTNFTKNDWDELSFLFMEITDPTNNLTKVMCEYELQDSLPFANLDPNVLRILSKISGDQAAAALLDVTCGKRHQLKNYSVGQRTDVKFKPAQIIEKLDQLLDHYNPAAVSYDWDFIKNDKNYVKQELNHTSTIVGRRYNEETKQCEYRIKDTAGNRCPKANIYECDKSNGMLWVPRANLQKNIYGVNWLEKLK